MLEHLFSGLAQGVGETKLAMEKEKRDRKDKEQQVKLQTITNLLSTPGLKPQQKSDLFNLALETASGGDKKIMEGMGGILGPILAQQQQSEGDSGQTGGVRTQSPDGLGAGLGAPPQPDPNAATGGKGESRSLPSSSLPKLGSSGQQSAFYTPEEETSQIANRAGAVAKATGQVETDNSMALNKQKYDLESEAKKKEGFHLVGFDRSKLAATGKVVPVYMNDMTRQTAYGGEMDPFTSQQVMQAEEMAKASTALAREEGVNNILQASGIDPQSATPEQRKKAEAGFAGLILQDQKAGIDAKRASAFRDTTIGLAAGDKSVEREGVQAQRDALNYNRQYDDYNGTGQKIQDMVKQVEDAKRKASEAYSNAMVVKNHLEQKQVSQSEPEYDPDDVQQGYTWDTYQRLIGEAKAALDNARSIAKAGMDRFKGQAEAGNLSGEPGQWPYLKDIREPFQYQGMGEGSPSGVGLPLMPQRGTSRKGMSIDVSDELLKRFQLSP